MPGEPAATVLGFVRDLLAPCPWRQRTDADLLARFVQSAESAAFAEIVRRHGPMVLGVCRRVLGNAADCDDVFQATFLVLTRKAGSIRRSQSLKCWLYGVAYRLALRANADAARRRSHEAGTPPGTSPADPAGEVSWREVQGLLDEELQRLPQTQRLPLLLCYLDGLTQDEAAAALGWPRGTLKRRLETGREKLRRRLTGRGLTLSAALVGTLLETARAASPPAELIGETVRVSLHTAAVGAFPPVPAAALARGVLQAMFVAKLKSAAAVAASLVVLTCGGLFLRPTAGDDDKPAQFRDVTATSGVHHTVRNGEEAGHLSPLESLGGGVAVLDYDGDGLLDLFVVGGGEFAGPDKQVIRGRPCKLYRNLGKHRFKDVTKDVGLDRIDFYSQGVAVGDLDCDGRPDLLVTGYRGLALFRNDGGKRFVDVTRAGGLEALPWSTSAAFADLDGDGYPDLYVCQYLDWSFANHPHATYDGKTRDVAPPKSFHGLPHRLYRNNKDGTFTDVSKRAGLKDSGKHAGKGLGVVVADFDGDGRPDVFVANDTTDNFLYLNRGKPGELALEEAGTALGVARDQRGVPLSSKGLAVGDYDGSGLPSVVVTAYENEPTTLFRNLRRNALTTFHDATVPAGLGRDQTRVGWGVAFADLDDDGHLDLIVANGHALRHPQGGAKRDQRPTVYRNLGNGKFEDVTSRAGAYFQRLHNARGLILADLDNTGTLDVITTHVNQPVVILQRAAHPQRRWLGLELVGKGRRDVAGAKVVVKAGDRSLTHFVSAGGSYLSSGDRRLVFGLGETSKIDSVTVEWPRGQKQVIDGGGVKLNRYWRIAEGSDAVEPTR